MDNASIHSSEEIIEYLLLYLSLKGIGLVLLPAYSPELNPCELVFAQVKNYLNHNRDSKLSLIMDIAFAFSRISIENVLNFYNKCCCS